MENYEEMYNRVCRVCLRYQSDGKLVSLIDNSAEDGLSCFGKAVIHFADVSIDIKDDHPKTICRNCLILLKQAILFKKTCESSQKSLLLMMQKVVNKDSNVASIQEIVIQNALFSHYFPNECPKKHSSSGTSVVSNDKIEESNYKLMNQMELDNDYNDCSFQENESSNSCQEDSGDEILNKLERITTFPSILGNDYNDRIKRKVKRNKLQAKKLRLARSRLQSRKINYIKSKFKSNKNSENLICKICHRVLANQLTYDHHMQRHNGCRFICEHCGKGFPILAELQMHQVARHGTGPFLQCQHCTYKAPRKLNLIEHERIHTGERPYTCDKCGLTFRRRAIWRKHMIYHMEKTVQCPHCPRKFFRRSEMQAHANSIHERLYVYLCHKCDATYAKTETVRRHLTERHGIPREMQGKIVRVNKGRGSVFPEQ